MPLSQLKTATNSGPVIISQTIIQPAKRAQQQAGSSSGAATSQQQQHQQPQQPPQLVQQAIQQQTPQQTHQLPQQQQQTQYILATPQQAQSQVQQQPMLPTLTSFTHTRPLPQTTTLYQATTAGGNGQAPTKILLKTSGTSGVVMTPLRQAQQQQTATVVSSNPPPLVATSAAVGVPGQNTLNIQNVQLPNRPVTIQPASQAAQQQHLQAQLQQHQPHPQHTIVANTTATQQPKLSQVIMQPSSAVGAGGVVNVSPTSGKNKTIILTQKGVILRNIGGDMYQQIPMSNVGNLQGLGAGTTLVTTTAAGPPSLVKTTPSTGVQLQQAQQQAGQPAKQILPTLIPTSSLGGQHVIVQQQQPTNVLGNVSVTTKCGV